MSLFADEEDEPGRATRLPQTSYARPLRYYAELLWPSKEVESCVRKLKRWIQKGKVAKDLPPLDEFPKLAAWYERHHRCAVAPEYLRQFEIEEEAAPDPGAAPPAEEQMPSMTLDLEAEYASDTGLKQVRALVHAIYEQMEVALKNGKADQYRTLRREWQSLVATQRQWEVSMLKIQEGRGEVLRTRVINSELVKIFTTSGQSFFNALLKVLQDHAPHLSADEQRKIALGKRDEVFTHLRGTRFEKTWIPEAQ